MSVEYVTGKVRTPEPLRRLGYGEAAWCDVYRPTDARLPAGVYAVNAHADFQRGVDPLNHLPTTIFVKGLDAAKTRADVMLADLEQWPTERYN